MTEAINYRKTSPETSKAWAKFKKEDPEHATSVVNFTAGWNAANNKVKMVYHYLQYRQGRPYFKGSVACFVAGWKAHMEIIGE
jgi:hypothetical protein